MLSIFLGGSTIKTQKELIPTDNIDDNTGGTTMSKEMRMEKAYKEAAALTGFCNWDEEARIAMIENSMAAELDGKADRNEIEAFAETQVEASEERRIQDFPINVRI